MILDTLEKAFKADDVEVITTYTADMSDITSETIKDLIECNGAAYIVQGGREFDRNVSDYALDAQGCIKHERVFLHTFTTEQKDCFEKSIAWLKKIWQTPAGELGPFMPGPVEYPSTDSLLKIWVFHPIGGIVKPVKTGGEFYAMSQPIEFAAQTI